MIVTLAILQVRGNEGLNLGRYHGNVKAGRPDLLQTYSHWDVVG